MVCQTRRLTFVDVLQIEKKLSLPYGPVGHPDVSPATLPKLATDLNQATIAFGAPGSLAREVLGNDFVDHFKGTREHEWNIWQTAVTNFEVRPSSSLQMHSRAPHADIVDSLVFFRRPNDTLSLPKRRVEIWTGEQTKTRLCTARSFGL